MRAGSDPAVDPASVRRLLVRAPNWLGDVVLALPAIGALRRRFADATITLVTRPAAAELLRGHPDVDDLMPDLRAAGTRSPLPVLAHARRLARARFDVAVVLARSLASALAVRLAGIPVRAGLASHHRSALLSHPVEESPDSHGARHHAELYLDVSRAIGASGDPVVPTLPRDDAATREADKGLAEVGIGAGEPFVVLHPGASRVERTWPPDRFGAVASRLAAARSWPAVVLGTRQEADLCRRAVGAAGPAAVDLCGKVGLRALVALHRRAALVIGNDSGAMHVAAAAGAPVIGIFGPGDPRKTAPLAPPGRFEAVSLGFPCSPCRQRFFHECAPAPSGRPHCLHDLDVERVLAAADRLLPSDPAEPGPGAATGP